MDFGELLASVNAPSELGGATTMTKGSPRESVASMPFAAALDGMELLAISKRRKPTDRVLVAGNVVMDNIFDVETYPREDTGQRALDARKSLGGHAGTVSRVLAQLQGARTYVSFVGTVPTVEDPDTAHAISTFKAESVDTSLLDEVGGRALPTSCILLSLDTGARTIVSTRHGVRELSVAHFTEAAHRAFAEEQDQGKLRWCHLECRQDPSVMLKMAEAWRAAGPQDDVCRPLSLEVARPTWTPEALLPLFRTSDYVFLSQEFVQGHAAELLAGQQLAAAEVAVRAVASGMPLAWDPKQHTAALALRTLAGRIGASKTVLVCLWGAVGSFALDVATGSHCFEPAVRVDHVVESAHAGDTFIAAFIHASLRRPDVRTALRCGSSVAGRKVSQVGFADLVKALHGLNLEDA